MLLPYGRWSNIALDVKWANNGNRSLNTITARFPCNCNAGTALLPCGNSPTRVPKAWANARQTLTHCTTTMVLLLSACNTNAMRAQEY
eukprot:5444855-Lingulodinium_polyedra.AAC.1